MVPLYSSNLAEAAAQPGVRRRGPDHKGAGALLAADHLGTAAMAIQGHHGGLRSLVEFQDWLEEHKKDPAVAEALTIPERDPTGLSYELTGANGHYTLWGDPALVLTTLTRVLKIDHEAGD